ncbi:MAG: VWA domain-containing protein [Lachnospiraceae bacterium]|nr:VWA domain-containing protein [Lachnospiraceae bacterium]
MKKKIIAALLSLTLGASMLTGCGTDKKLTETNPSKSVEEDIWYENTDDTCVEAEEYPAESYDSSSRLGMAPDSSQYSVEANNKCTTNCEYAYDCIPYNSGETYSFYDENGFKKVSDSPLSTFSADVDTASYSNMRRLVNEGFGLYDFAGVSLRAEEIINYFKYDYSAPKKGERFGVDSAVFDCPWNKDNKLCVMGINTNSLKDKKAPDSNIVFLVDVSGSMASENKLPLLKDSMELLVENLTKKDRVSIVTYANGTRVILDGVSGDSTDEIICAFESLRASGGTNGEGGIEEAYRIADANFIKGGNNRVILATDGDFNIGKCSESELEDLISEKKDSGVFLSVLGFGIGNYNDAIAETLADKGNGNYSYIDTLAEAKKVLVDEMSSTLYTVAKDTKFQVEFNPSMVSSYRLVGYENRALNDEDFTDDTKDGGEIGAGHQVTVLYEISLKSEGSDQELKYQETSLSKKGRSKDEWCTLSIAYKDPDKNESKYLEYPIGADNYTNKPSDSFILATSAAEYAMALSDSSYLVDLSREDAVDQAIYNVRKLDSNDETVQEFLNLMERVMNREEPETGLAWYE